MRPGARVGVLKYVDVEIGRPRNRAGPKVSVAGAVFWSIGVRVMTMMNTLMGMAVSGLMTLPEA